MTGASNSHVLLEGSCHLCLLDHCFLRTMRGSDDLTGCSCLQVVSSLLGLSAHLDQLRLHSEAKALSRHAWLVEFFRQSNFDRSVLRGIFSSVESRSYLDWQLGSCHHSLLGRLSQQKLRLEAEALNDHAWLEESFHHSNLP